MRGKGNGAIESVLRTADHDHARDRILRAQFWTSSSSPRGEVIALESRRNAASR